MLAVGGNAGAFVLGLRHMQHLGDMPCTWGRVPQILCNKLLRTDPENTVASEVGSCQVDAFEQVLLRFPGSDVEKQEELVAARFLTKPVALHAVVALVILKAFPTEKVGPRTNNRATLGRPSRIHFGSSVQVSFWLKAGDL